LGKIAQTANITAPTIGQRAVAQSGERLPVLDETSHARSAGQVFHNGSLTSICGKNSAETYHKHGKPIAASTQISIAIDPPSFREASHNPHAQARGQSPQTYPIPRIASMGAAALNQTAGMKNTAPNSVQNATSTTASGHHRQPALLEARNKTMSGYANR